MYSVYRRLAADLGMRLAPEDPGMMTFSFDLFGDLDGHPVTLRRVCGSGAYIAISAPVLPHMDLGLGLGRSGFVSQIAEWFGAEDIEVGDPGFDAAFAIRGDEPERVRALLTPSVRAALASVQASSLELTDATFSSTRGTGEEDPAPLEAALREAVRIARAIEEAHTAVPPAAALRAHHQAWTTFARQRGFQGGSTPLWMQGKLGQVRTYARALRKSAGEFTLELAARLEQPLSIRLSIDPRRSHLPALLGSKSAPTGDARFDEAFQVTATPADLVDEELRQRLLELHALGTVYLDAQGATLRGDAAALDPARVPVVLEDLRSVLEHLERKVNGPTAPYR